MVTYAVSSLDQHLSAWTRYLGYNVIADGTIATELATAWSAPAAAGLPYAIAEPSSGDAVWLRFIETGSDLPFQYPLYQGWNATELLVENPDQLAADFADSPFKVIGGPHDLYATPKAPRAIQVIGPGGELLYFSRLLPGGSRYGLKGAKSYVDRTFNVIAGGTDLRAMGEFYHQRLGLRTFDPITFTIPMLADVCGAPPATPFSLQIAKIAGRRFIIELDEYPPHVPARPVSEGHLPPGMAMVSFLTDSLDAFDVSWHSPPKTIDSPGYEGQRTAVTRGAAGEWIELIERSK